MKTITRIVLLLFVASFAVNGQYTGSYPNVASFKTATASDTVTGFGADKAVDTLLTTYCSVVGTAPAWLQVDLGAFFYVHGFGIVFPNSDELPADATFQISEDGSDWFDAHVFTVDGTGTISLEFSGIGPARYARFNFTPSDPLISVAEIMVYGQDIPPPSTPQAFPASNITSTSFTANWNEKNRADGYILTVARQPDLTDRLDGYSNRDVGDVLSWDIDGLDPVTNYYYMVVAYNMNGNSANSNIMEVTTAKIPQSINFDAIPAITYADTVLVLDATATSGLPVTYVSSNNEVGTISGDSLMITGAGTTVITAYQFGNSLYDTAQSVDQNLQVNVKEIIVENAVALDKVYDGTNAAVIQGAVLAGVVGDDEVVLANGETGEFSQVNAGENLQVTTSMTLEGSDMDNYSLVTPADLMADITPKELIVTAVDESREECAPNPDFTLEYSGFVGEEDETVLTELPEASSLADEHSPGGDYSIIVTGGSADNYTFSHENGTLTVNPDMTDPVLEVNDFTVQLDETGTAFISPADLVANASDNCGIADTTLSRTAFGTGDVGNVSVEVVVSDENGNTASAFADVTVVGVESVEDYVNLGVNLFPNPTMGRVDITLRYRAKLIQVMDVTGKIVLERPGYGLQETIDLSDMKRGLYFFKIEQNNSFVHVKVFKK